MTSRTATRLLVSFVLVALPASVSAGPEPLEFEIAPQELRIGAFFAGRTVTLSGSAGESVDVAVEVFGPEEAGDFHLKGKVGPLWMNVERVELGHAPHLYLLLTSDDVRPGEELVGLGIGLKHVENKFTVRPENLDKEMIFEQFLKLKRSEDLYDECRGAVTYGSPNGGRRSFRAEFLLPSSTAPGAYEIVATGLSTDGSIGVTTRDFQVAEAGVIKAIHDFAFEHGLVYGIFCVVIALAVGGVMGVFFRRTGTH
ncbi:MAG: TIGR02186 family protein [Acidobacteria bacterium]|nr:TIGR02186 family protein [Acidobacteriota bacterium]